MALPEPATRISARLKLGPSAFAICIHKVPYLYAQARYLALLYRPMPILTCTMNVIYEVGVRKRADGSAEDNAPK